MVLNDEEFVPEARAIFHALRANRIQLCAPATLHAEFGHAMRGAFMSKRVPEGDLIEACSAIAMAPVEILDVRPVTTTAMQLALKHRASFYDAIYVALALREETRVVTGDRPMCNAFASIERCTHLADFVL